MISLTGEQVCALLHAIASAKDDYRTSVMHKEALTEIKASVEKAQA